MIFITGYPYVGARHLQVFQSFHEKDDLVFILPESWPMKGGKVVLYPDTESGLNIIATKARFSHSRYFLLRGLMKGWMPGLSSILRKSNAKAGDVLYTVNEPNLLVTYINARIAKRLGMKHVFFTWQNVAYSSRLTGAKLWLTERLIRANVRHSIAAVCGNLKAKEILSHYTRKDFPVLVEPVSGINPNTFKPGEPTTFRADHGLEGKTVLLFIGAMDNRKGIVTLIDSLVSVVEQDKNVRLVMIGEGPLKESIKSKVKSLKLDDVVTILPWSDNSKLPSILSAGDVFVYPSEPYGGWEEQFGYSAAEASACGLPVITTTTGSLPDIIQNEKTGIVIPHGDASLLSKAILRLTGDRALREAMGKAGREYVLSKYSNTIVGEQLENFLRTI